MTTPTTETNGTQHHRARGNGTEASQLGSRKVYVLGSTPRDACTHARGDVERHQDPHRADGGQSTLTAL